jgi:hypothetical protein
VSGLGVEDHLKFGIEFDDAPRDLFLLVGVLEFDQEQSARRLIAPPVAGSYGALLPAKARNTGETIIALPEGFEYAVIGRTGSKMSDGAPTPAAHDGMAAFNVNGELRLVRNHEINGGIGRAASSEEGRNADRSSTVRRRRASRPAPGCAQCSSTTPQPKINHPVAAQPEDRAQRLVNPRRPEGCHPVTEDAQVGLSAPSPPDHSQVRVIEFVRQEAQNLLGVKIGEIEAVRRGAVRADEQLQVVQLQAVCRDCWRPQYSGFMMLTV